MPSLGGLEWLILAVLVLGLPVLVVVLVVRSARATKKRTHVALDAVFTGAPVVNYQLAPYAPPYEEVVADAARRGYQLTQQTQAGLLTFTLKATGA